MALNKNKVIAAAQKYQQKGQIDKAIKELQRLVDEDPKDVRTLLKIGDLYTKKGDRSLATSTYLRVAQFYSEQGFYLKAVAVYKQILRVDQNIVDVHVKLAELYHQLGLVSDAMAQFQQVVTHYERQGQIHESLMVLKKMVDLDPDNIASRIKLAELCSSQGLMEDAVREFESASAYLKEQGRIDDYVKVAERLVFHDAERFDVLRELSTIYLQRGDTKRSLAKLQICFKADPRNVATLMLLAQAFGALGQTQKTVSVYKELAKIHEEEGRTDQVEDVWRKIEEAAPNDPDLQARRGLISQPRPQQEQKPLSFPGASLPGAESIPPVAPPPPPPPAPPVEPASAPASQAMMAPAAPAAPAPPAAASSPDEVAGKLLTETDVYVKYGLKDRALDHLKKIFEQVPDYEPAYEKQKSIALSMGDRNLAARSVESLVRFMLLRGDKAAAAAQVAELEGFLPGYAGIPGLRAALDGGPIPEPSAEGDNDFDDVSVEIALTGEDDLDDAVVVPAALEGLEQPEEVIEAISDSDVIDASDASIVDAVSSEVEVVAEHSDLELIDEEDDLMAAAQSLMDAAVRSVVDEDLDELVEEEPLLAIPDEPLDGLGEPPPTLVARRNPGQVPANPVESDSSLDPGSAGGFEEPMPTNLMTANELANLQESYKASVEAARVENQSIGLDAANVLPDDSMFDLSAPQEVPLPETDAVLGAEGLLGATDEELLQGDAGFLDSEEVSQEIAVDSIAQAELVEAPDVVGGDLMLDATAAMEQLNDDADLNAALEAAAALEKESGGAIAADADMFLEDDGVLLDAPVLEEMEDGLLELPDTEAFTEAELGDASGLEAFDQGGLLDAEDMGLDGELQSGILDHAPPVAELGAPPNLGDLETGPSLEVSPEDVSPAGVSTEEAHFDADDAGDIAALAVPAAGVELDEMDATVTLNTGAVDETAGLSDDQEVFPAEGKTDLVEIPEGGILGAEAPAEFSGEVSSSLEQGSVADPELTLEQSIAAAENYDGQGLEFEAGAGTATEVMGLSPEELAEIRAFASADGRPAAEKPAVVVVDPDAFSAELTDVSDGEVSAGEISSGSVSGEAAVDAKTVEVVAVTDAQAAPPAPQDPAEDFFPDELSEADFLIRQGLYEEAQDVVQAILDDVPESPRAQAMMAEIQRQQGSADDLSAADDSFDLAAELLDDIGELADSVPASDDFQYSVDEVFDEFKKGVSATVSDDDVDTHYDLGIAYREMGLVEDSINEFEIAAKNERKAADALYMIGICQAELGRPSRAVGRYKEALHCDNVTKAQKIAILFELGVAYQQLDDPKEALYYLGKVQKQDKNFKDVAERIRTLQQAGESPGPAKKKGRNISYL